MEGAVDALMAVIVDRGQDLLLQRRHQGNVQAAFEGDHAVHKRPWSGVGPFSDLVMDGDQGRVSGLGMSEALDEVKVRRRDSHNLPFFIVTMGEGIGDDIHGA
jgi:hypothetical protein